MMEKKTTGTAITKNFAKKMETISPFELKNKLIEMADETVAAEQEQEIEAEANEIDELNKKLDEANTALEKEKKKKINVKDLIEAERILY